MERFEKGDVEIYGLSADPPKMLKKFVDKCHFTYKLLSDENHETLDKLGVWVKKKLYGREYEGIFRNTYVIDENGVIQHFYKKINVKTHAQDILNDLG